MSNKFTTTFVISALLIASLTAFGQGVKQKISGIIIKRDGETLVIKDHAGKETNVRLSFDVQIEEKKSNPFRGARQYDRCILVRGLILDVKGIEEGGAITAKKIKIIGTDLRIAQSLDSRANPLEGRTTENDKANCCCRIE